MLEQTRHACQAFKVMAPDCVGIFFFDHSSGHAALPPDALNPAVLKMGDISKAKNMPAPSRDGWFLLDGKHELCQEWQAATARYGDHSNGPASLEEGVGCRL